VYHTQTKKMMTSDEEKEGSTNWWRYWYRLYYYQGESDSIIKEWAFSSWKRLNTQEKSLCLIAVEPCEDVYKVFMNKLKLYILCSAFMCPRISSRSKFKKFPIDLTRKLKDFLI